MRAFVIEAATVRTMDPRRPIARALSVEEGRIVAVDRPDTGVDRIHLGGATIVPGLIDSHLHLVLGGELLLQLDLSAVRSRRDFEGAIAARHAEVATGSWLLANGWNEDNFGSRCLPDETWLAAAGDRPAVAWRMDQHSVLVNGAVLKLIAERHDLSRDPPGGRVVRDPSGRPTGLLQEAAAWTFVRPLMPSPSAVERRAAVALAHRHLATLGLTTVGSMEYAAVMREAVVPSLDRFRVRMRVTLLDREWPLDLSLPGNFPSNPLLAVIGMKAFVDGTLGSRTAAMLEEYADDPGNRGLLVELAERGLLVAWIKAVRAAGLSPSMHAIGDHATRLALDAVDASDGPAVPWARIEHAQTIAPEDLPRFRGRVASMQPLHKAYDAASAASRLGPARMDRFFPFRHLLDAGASLAFGSDWPIVSADPLRGMQAAITGRDLLGKAVRPEENLTPEEALRAYTSDAARSLGSTDTGVLREGAAADFTILDRDPFTCDWRRECPGVLATVVGGAVTFEAPGILLQIG